MLSKLTITAAVLGLVGGCTLGYDVGRDRDGGTSPDAPAPDGGASDGGRCFVRCGPSLECCGDGTECIADTCRPVCAGSRCGAEDSVCCASGELCVNAACATPGDACVDDIDCGATDYCDLGLARCLPRPDVECTYQPPEGVFTSELVWAWDEADVISIPLVVQLTDDDGDGAIDARDVPDVVAITYDARFSDFAPIAGGRVVALSGDDGRVLWRSEHPGLDVCVASSPAAGDLDGDGTTEIVVLATEAAAGGCQGFSSLEGTPLHVLALSHLGALEWRAADPISAAYPALAWTGPGLAVADLDGDGRSEILAPGVVLESDGEVRFWDLDLWTLAHEAFPFAADVHGDAALEIVTPHGVWNADGTVLWSQPGLPPAAGWRGFVLGRVITDRPAHPGPQIVAVDRERVWVLDAATGDDVVPPFSYATVERGFVGPPTLADFDGDGRSELGFAGPEAYFVIDFDEGAPRVLWSVTSTDVSTASVGTTVFDFDGNGSAEVVWNDECRLKVLRGTDGVEVGGFANTTATAWESPVVADVTGDGRANLVVVANDDGECAMGAPNRGIRVLRSPTDDWIGARPVWNQHAFFYDNVTDDLAVPRAPRASWSTHNTFRLNRFPNPATVFLAPDLRVVTVSATNLGCPARIVVRARVQNDGARSVAAGAAVAFYADDGGEPATLLGIARTTELIGPGGATWVELEVRDVPLDDVGSLRVVARADDLGTVPYVRGEINECREDDNAAAIVLDCGLI